MTHFAGSGCHPGGSDPFVDRHDCGCTPKASLPVGESGVAETPFTYEQALAWLTSHPAAEPHFVRFQNLVW